MAELLLQALTGKPGAAATTLIDGVVATGYRLELEAHWGNPIWEAVFSGTRGTQGAVLAAAELKNREVAVPLQVRGTSHDDLEAKIGVVAALAYAYKRYGGRMTWRPQGGTYRGHFRVQDATATIDRYGVLYYKNHVATVLLLLTVAPYVEGDPMDVYDDFSVDSIADYTLDTGSSLSVSGGQLVPGSNTLKEVRYSANGYEYGDQQATAKVTTGSSTTGLDLGVRLKCLASNRRTYLLAYVGGGNLNLSKVAAGAGTSLATTAFALAVGTTYWVRGRIEGNVFTAEVFIAEPTPTGTPAATVAYTLTPAEAAIYGQEVVGQAGIYFDPNNTDLADRVDDFRVDPYTYRNVALPEQLVLRGAVPGNAPALFDAVITDAGGTEEAKWGVVAWWERALPWNMVWNGHFEDDTEGWLGSGGHTAGTSTISRVTTAAKFGLASLQVVTPATNLAGANFKVYARFKRGVTYTLVAWVRSAAGTTLVQAAAGLAADSVGGTSVALSTAQQQITVTWVPTADRDTADFTVRQAAATATTFTIDGAMVYEGTTAPALRSQQEGRGGAPALGIIEGESAKAFSPWAVVAGGDQRLGQALEMTGAQTDATAHFYIDPSVLVGDEYAGGEIAVEVWGRIELANTLTLARVAVGATSAEVFAGPTRYTEEYGSTGRLLEIPTGAVRKGMYRLGTLRLVVDRAAPSVVRMVFIATTTGTGVFALDYLLLLPAAARAANPTGKTDQPVPTFIAGVTERTKRIRSDLSAAAAVPPGPLTPDYGVGGSLLEMPPGAVDALVKLSGHWPNTVPTAGVSGQEIVVSHTATVHFAVTPRWAYARPS